MIDLTSFRNALSSLDVGLRAYATAPDDDFIRDACLQRFKYCYELSHTTLRRCLRETAPTEADGWSFQTMIKLGVEQGLLTRGWDTWSEFRTARKNASEAGDEANAALGALPAFMTEANFLCAAVERRQVLR